MYELTTYARIEMKLTETGFGPEEGIQILIEGKTTQNKRTTFLLSHLV